MWNLPVERINVLVRLVEPLLQAGVCATLRDAEHFSVLTSAQLSCDESVRVVVTDWTSGLQFARGDGRPQVRILAICPHAREHSVELALRNGVHGLIRASCSVNQLVEAVKTLALGAPYVCPDVAQRMAATCARDALTAREEEVLRLLARGKCNKTIACELGIAVGTVKTHVKGIMAKLDAASRTEAASIAAEKGIVDVPEFRSRRAAWSPTALLGSKERAVGTQQAYAPA